MLWSTRRYSRLLAVAGAVGAIGVLVQQSALSQLGLTEAASRDLVAAEVRSGNALGPSGAYSQLVTAGRKAYQKVPVAARGAVTTALFAWAKSYANTPAFKAAYGKIRSEMQPQHRQYALTVEQEVQKNIQEQLASVEAIKKTTASMSAKDRAQTLELARQAEANVRNPAIVNADRAEREAARAKDRAEIEEATKEWEARYPPKCEGMSRSPSVSSWPRRRGSTSPRRWSWSRGKAESPPDSLTQRSGPSPGNGSTASWWGPTRWLRRGPPPSRGSGSWGRRKAQG